MINHKMIKNIFDQKYLSSKQQKINYVKINTNDLIDILTNIYKKIR